MISYDCKIFYQNIWFVRIGLFIWIKLVLWLHTLFSKSPMSLANKYRPTTFDDVVEQTHIIPILQAQANAEAWQNNFLLYWPRWTGKTSSARLLAKSINCLQPRDWNSCNTCENCVLIQNNTTMDIVEIDAASHTWVDNIREEILDKALYKPTILKKKVYIIDEVHMLSKWAFNALLKIMEEPAPYLVFILATTEIHKVPDTIISRCYVLQFSSVSADAMVTRLEKIAQLESIPYTQWWLSMIAQVADWWMRDAIKYLDQIRILWEINEETVASFLWIASQQDIIQYCESLQQSIIHGHMNDQLLDILWWFTKKWIDVYQFAKDCLKYINIHFHEDPQNYVIMTDVHLTLLQEAKRFPSPLLAMKSSIFKHLHSSYKSA